MTESEPDRLSPDDCVEQWMFDFYVDKCVSGFIEDGEQGESWRQILETLMSQSIYEGHGHNRIKARVLLVIDYMLKLESIDLASFPWEESTRLLELEEKGQELLDLLEELKTVLAFLKDCEDLQESSIAKTCQSSLLHTYSFMVQLICHLKQAAEPIFNLSLDVKDLLYQISQDLENFVGHFKDREKKTFEACQLLCEGETGSLKNLPPRSELPSLLTSLVTQIYNMCFSKPEILKLAESYIFVQSKLLPGKGGNGSSSKLDLELLLNENDNQNSSEKYVPRSRKVEGHRLTKKERQLKGSNGSRSISCDSSSSESTSSSLQVPPQLSNPQPDSPHRKGRSPSPQAGPTISKRLRRRQNLVEKPVSRARGAWRPQEEEDFIVAVLTFGQGNWQEVKAGSNSKRTNQQLKDKWRNISWSRIESVAKEYQLAMPPKQEK